MAVFYSYFMNDMLSEMATEFNPPDELLRPLHAPETLLMGPGPSNCYPEILEAASKQVLDNMQQEFFQILHETKAGIQYAFQTRNAYTFAVSGTGTCAMEAALCNILEPGDTCVCAINGIWGERAANIAFRHGAKVHQVYKTFGSVFAFQDLEEAISNCHPTCLYICHGESSTGTLQPLEGIGDLCHKYGCLLIVDAVASLGGVPLFMDKWDIDVLYSGSQKVLSAPPGISPISFGQRALEKIKSRKSPVQSYYLDALLIGNYWGCDSHLARYHHTAPISSIFALRTALHLLAKETLEKSWRRHQQCADMLYQGLSNMGLKFFVEDKKFRLATVTVVHIREGADWKAVCSYMKSRHKLVISGGLGPTADRVWRIGLMGHNCTPENVKFVLKVFDEALFQESKSRL